MFESDFLSMWHGEQFELFIFKLQHDYFYSGHIIPKIPRFAV